MTDVSIVCNNKGLKLDELPISVMRQYKITTGVSSANASFSISIRDAKATGVNLRYTNIIYINSDLLGLRDYAAVIWPTDNGTSVKDELGFNLRSYEWILSTRYTGPQDIIEGTPGQIAAQLLKTARRAGFLPIVTDETGINMGGKALKKEYNCMPIYKALNDLAVENGFLWYLLPSIDTTTNLLTMKLIWDYQRTRIFPTKLSTGGDTPYLSVSQVRERGEIANHVIAFGRFDDWSKPIISEPQESQASQSFYQQVIEYVVPNNIETTVEALNEIAYQYLVTHAFPQLTIDGVINYPPYPRFGDIVTIEAPTNNSFIVDRRGSDVTMQITNTVYSPDDDSYSIHAEEILSIV